MGRAGVWASAMGAAVVSVVFCAVGCGAAAMVGATACIVGAACMLADCGANTGMGWGGVGDGTVDGASYRGFVGVGLVVSADGLRGTRVVEVLGDALRGVGSIGGSGAAAAFAGAAGSGVGVISKVVLACGDGEATACGAGAVGMVI